MKILAITLARHGQFSGIFDVLRHRHEITLVAPDGTGEAPGLRSVPFTPVRVTSGSRAERALGSFLGTARAVASALEPLRRERFDVVFGQVSFGCTHEIRRVVGAPVVSHVELPGREMATARPELPPPREDIEAGEAHRALVDESLRASDLIITPSRHAAGLLPRDVAPRVRVGMEGLRVGPLRDAAARRALRERHGLPVDAPLLGYFGGTLEAERGFDVFVQAAREVRRALPGAAFLVVGEPVTHDGGEQAALGGESFKDYALRTAGMAERDLMFRRSQSFSVDRELVAAVDAAVFPSFESAGHWSFFDSLAEGTPAVAARRAFFPEVIRDGQNVLLSDVRDVADFAARSIALLTLPGLRARIGRAAWETARRDFTEERAAARYEAVFEEAARSPARATPS
ncbi:glycosyltransferase [Sorangium sp. So ce1024]|uniref:glycosyltransferase n=1 Tax=Sorangium sp. So ce1024 TaxID=3133327 RepID=UPI003EFE5114